MMCNLLAAVPHQLEPPNHLSDREEANQLGRHDSGRHQLLSVDVPDLLQDVLWREVAAGCRRLVEELTGIPRGAK